MDCVPGALIFAFLFCGLLVLPMGYLFGLNTDTEKGRDGALGCTTVVCFVVFFAVAWVCNKYGIDMYSDEFMMKWLPISFGSLSGILILGCISKALVKNFSE